MRVRSNLIFCRKEIWSFLKVLDYQILEELINLRVKCSFQIWSKSPQESKLTPFYGTDWKMGIFVKKWWAYPSQKSIFAKHPILDFWEDSEYFLGFKYVSQGSKYSRVIHRVLTLTKKLMRFYRELAVS